MFGVISFRVYLIVAICVAAVCSATVYFDTNQAFAGFFTRIGQEAERFGLSQTIADFVIQPIAFAFSDYYWAIAAGALWPLMVLWFIMFLFVLGVTIFGPSLTELNTVG